MACEPIPCDSDLLVPLETVRAIAVNTRQYERIVKRRITKQKLVKEGRIPAKRQPFMYNSRHVHSVNRFRTQSGRFAAFAESDLAFTRPANAETATVEPLKTISWIPIIPVGFYPICWNEDNIPVVVVPSDYIFMKAC